ncbi:DUF2752 domain-containing protein [Butyrivibrio proteoclasticus]|uniref:DUF2752 domain-containing protein n=1 Tax=Butyrivibrio proteoclasticus TaxID=43305 RepID=UPI00047B3BD6|nr:DUF2752 domain-containing protein [Butyrivibrio proteoclasticus]
MKLVLKRIYNDIYANRIPIMALSVIILSLHLIFHHVCPVVLLTGFPCPACGLTRAFLACFSMHPVAALSYNPAYPLWLAAIFVFIVKRYFLNQKHTKSFRYLFLTVIIMTILVYIHQLIYVFPSHSPMSYSSDNLMATIHPEYDQLIQRIINK